MRVCTLKQYTMIKTKKKKNRPGDGHERSPLHLRRLKSQHHEFHRQPSPPPRSPLLMASLPRRVMGFNPSSPLFSLLMASLPRMVVGFLSILSTHLIHYFA